MDIERIIDSEMYILGTCINDNNYMVQVLEQLKENDFYRTKHKIIFKAMTELFTSNIPFDISILATKMINEIKSNAITLTELTLIAEHTAYRSINSHLLLVKKETLRRAIKGVCKEVIESTAEIEEDIETLQNALTNINADSEEDKIYTMSEVMEKTMSQIERAYKTKDGITGISTGIRSVDNVTNGLQRKDFVLFGARPSMGKTAFSLKMLQGIKGNILYVQIDMSLEGMGQRMLSANSFLENGKVGRGRLNDNEWEKVAEQFSRLAERQNLFFYEPSTTTVNKIRNMAKQVQIKHGLDVIIIDHIGKVNGGGKDAYESAGRVSQGLKALAKEMNVCVIGLVQLNRGCEQRPDKHPMLSDLRDSGKIEEDADVIGLLYRDGYYKQRQDGQEITKDVLEIDFQKCRNGKVGKIELHYDLTTQRLSEIQRY